MPTPYCYDYRFLVKHYTRVMKWYQSQIESIQKSDIDQVTKQEEINWRMRRICFLQRDIIYNNKLYILSGC